MTNQEPQRQVIFKYEEATQSTAAKIVLNPMVQVVAPEMYKAFRQADLHNNIQIRASYIAESAQEHF